MGFGWREGIKPSSGETWVSLYQKRDINTLRERAGHRETKSEIKQETGRPCATFLNNIVNRKTHINTCLDRVLSEFV